MPQHMPLEEWDRRVAPFLATIAIRAGHICTDAQQIREWVRIMPVAPDFPTHAIAVLQESQTSLEQALNDVKQALVDYAAKEKVK